MHACGYVWTRCARGHRYVCVPRQMPLVSVGARVALAIHSSKYIYVHGHPSIFRCVYFGAASRHACGRAFAAGARAGAPACICFRVQSPFRMHRCAYHVHAGVCARMRGDFLWICPFEPMPVNCCPAGAAAGASIARQVHLLHEGEGAPRVARPVQALGDPVRLRRSLARLRRCRRAVPGAGPHHAALDVAAAALPLGGGGRAPRAHGWRTRPTGARSRVGRSRPARPHGWRAGSCTTPRSRSCRRRPSGPS